MSARCPVSISVEVAQQLLREEDIVAARATVKKVAAGLGLSLVNQTKVITAASELARNTLEHGGGGQMVIEVIEVGLRKGMRIVFEDRGPGMESIEKCLQSGYTTAGGMGLGLGGSKRLVDEFSIEMCKPGTRVTVIKWS